MTSIWTPLFIGLGISLAGISAISAPANAQDVRNRCSSDVSAHCAGLDEPQMRLQCLIDNKDSLSSDCQAAIQEQMEQASKRTPKDKPAGN